MTCVLGLKHAGKVYIGADGLYTTGWHRIHSSQPKIFKRDDMLIGTSGSMRLSDIIQYNAKFDGPYHADPIRYIACEVVPAIRAAIKEHGDLSDMEDLTIMIGYAGHLFVLDENLAISDIDEYEAIGVGAKYALGYMYANRHDEITPEDLVEQSLECASHFCFGCSGPFVIDSI